MTTTSTILKIGNSCGIIIPARILKSLSLGERDEITITETGGVITLRKCEQEAVETPFSRLDRWCEENGVLADESLEEILGYAEDVRSGRKNKEIPQW